MTKLTTLVRRFYDQFKTNYDNTNWWRSVIIGELVIGHLHSVLADTDEIVYVMDGDWDNLVVLDGCRADLFEETYDPDLFDDYTAVESAGSKTPEWIEKNFADGSYGDTVYVTANPFVSKLAGDAFHRIVDVWRDSFDDEYRTILPEAVVEAALDAHVAHPDKRLIVHFMQPHMPFVKSDDLRFTGWEPAEITDHKVRSGRPRGPWDALEMGVVSREQVWEGYRENLAYVLEHLTPLLSSIEGKTVVTSDHGNLLGERIWPVPIRMYGHPRRIRHPGLVDVPWATSVMGQRRTITHGRAEGQSEQDSAELERKLASLGYHG